jgi:sensor c-di-GMP phosphodiesterase-like protein
MKTRTVGTRLALVLAVGMLSLGCNHKAEIEKATARAEDGARRAESAASRVEAAAKRAETAADRVEQMVSKAMGAPEGRHHR